VGRSRAFRKEKVMKKAVSILAALAALTLALPASAAGCQEVTLADNAGTPQIVATSGEMETVRVMMVGTFLNYELGPEAEARGLQSIEVVGAVGATVCDDGSVTLHEGEPAPAPERTEFELPTPEEVAEIEAGDEAQAVVTVFPATANRLAALEG
jgi:hypothetical protein